MNTIISKLKAVFSRWIPWFKGSESTAELEPHKAKQTKARKPRKKKKKLTWNSFKYLKGYLDSVFSDLEKHDYFDKRGVSLNVSKHVVKSLRSLGPYMMAYSDTGAISLTREESENPVYMQCDKRTTPALAFIGYPDDRDEATERLRKDNNNKDATLPRFVYASLLNKREYIPHVEMMRRTEVIYEVGVAIYEDNPPKWLRKAKDKLVWVAFLYALDTATGKTRTLRHWETEWTGKHSRKILKGPSEKEFPIFRHSALAEILNQWATRDMHWQVLAVKGKKRVTFCIDDNHAKDYFKDRYIQDGLRRKPIFHWVKSHYRDTGKKVVTVKTHTRGKQVFKWGEYDIAIRQPGKDSFMMSDFDLEPIDEAHADKNTEYITMNKAIKNLRKHELVPDKSVIGGGG